MPCHCGKTTKCITNRCDCRKNARSCSLDCKCGLKCCQNGVATSNLKASGSQNEQSKQTQSSSNDNIFEFSDSLIESNTNLEILQSLAIEHNISLSDENSNDDNWKEHIYQLNDEFNSGFKVLFLNANSIYNKMSNFNDLLVKRCIDMLIIEESKLSSDVPNEYYSFVGYKIFRRDRTRHGGGILVLIKDTYEITLDHIDTIR